MEDPRQVRTVEWTEEQRPLKDTRQDVEDFTAAESSVSEESTLAMEEEARAEACSLLVQHLFLHKQAFEAENEDEAQEHLTALADLDREGISEEVLEAEPFGGLLRVIADCKVHLSKQAGWGDLPCCGVWRDKGGNFYGGSAIEVKDGTWNPRRHRTSFSSFHRSKSEIVERLENGTEKRMSLQEDLDTGTLLVFANARMFVLHPHYDWDRWPHFSALSQVWQRLSVELVAVTMREAGPLLANKFVHSLAVKLPSELVGGLSVQKLKADNDVDVASGWLDPRLLAERDAHGRKEHFEAAFPSSLRSFHEKRRLMGRQSSIWRELVRQMTYCSERHKTEVNIYYCCCKGALDLGHQQAKIGPMEMLMYLATLPEKAMVFTTPFAQAVVANCWRNVLNIFIWQRVMDMAFQVILSVAIAPISRNIGADKDYTMPTGLVLMLSVYFFTRSTALFLMECASVAYLWAQDLAKSAVFPFPVNAVSMIRVSMEAYSALWGYRLLRDLYSNTIHGNRFTYNETSPYKHPMGIALLIFARYVQFMMSILCFKSFRTTLLPTWWAIKSRESVMFITYMLVLTFGCALAYMALPYSMSTQKSGDMALNYLRPFFRMFRLNIMGDFDMHEFLGDGEVINRTCSEAAEPKDCVWHIQTLHKSYVNRDHELVSERTVMELKVWIALLALIFPVIFLNVYVGLVCEAYSDAKSKITQITGMFVSTSIQRVLLIRYYWDTLVRCGRRRADRPGQDHWGAFIRLPTSLVLPPL